MRVLGSTFRVHAACCMVLYFCYRVQCSWFRICSSGVGFTVYCLSVGVSILGAREFQVGVQDVLGLTLFGSGRRDFGSGCLGLFGCCFQFREYGLLVQGS